MANGNFKEWYTETYPSDELGECLNPNVTFLDLIIALSNKRDIYDAMGAGDSIIRERLFEELSKRLPCDYYEIYNLWLYGPEYVNVTIA